MGREFHPHVLLMYSDWLLPACLGKLRSSLQNEVSYRSFPFSVLLYLTLGTLYTVKAARFVALNLCSAMPSPAARRVFSLRVYREYGITPSGAVSCAAQPTLANLGSLSAHVPGNTQHWSRGARKPIGRYLCTCIHGCKFPELHPARFPTVWSKPRTAHSASSHLQVLGPPDQLPRGIPFDASNMPKYLLSTAAVHAPETFLADKAIARSPFVFPAPEGGRGPSSNAGHLRTEAKTQFSVGLIFLKFL